MRRAGRQKSVLAALLVGPALTGCGASRAEVDPGFPPANPRPHRAAALLPLLSGQQLRISVPSGWQVARLNAPATGRQALVRLVSPCYESISVTGSSIQQRSPAQIAARYLRASLGSTWTVNHVAGHAIALLAQYTSQSTVPNRATVGTAYLPLDAHRQLVVDFGAGIWPLRRGACTGGLVAGLVAPLRATALQVFGPGTLVVGPDGGP